MGSTAVQSPVTATGRSSVSGGRDRAMPMNTWLAPLGLLAAAALSACGGGNGTTEVLASAQTLTVPADTAIAAAAADGSAAVVVAPTYHLAPVELAAPDDGDSDGNALSAARGPHRVNIDDSLAAQTTRGLTLDDIRSRARIQSSSTGSATPQAGSTAVATYTPAQVRAAYGLPALTAAGVTPTADQAAQQGAGQTIYLIAAYHDPNIAAELAAFNAKFGLPTCATQAIPTTTTALAAASTTAGCTLSVVYTNSSGAMTATAPAYNSGWATEIALDVQWAHATAPRARLVLIEAADASLNSLAGAVRRANALGPGIVSMSFGASEGSWISSYDSAFSGSRMSYVAATGDNGAGVSWPSSSAGVLAVGGTSLTWSGSGTRAETVWSGTGGGQSAYVARPSYQTTAISSLFSATNRLVADVAFNANPYTGQYVAVQPQGGSLSWISAGGTSLSTPQWAGLLAVTNALRARAGAAEIGAPHAALYQRIAAVPGNYAAALMDVTSGNDGSCTLCTARSGYDAPTGLGTPNASALLTQLTGASSASTSTGTGTTTPSGAPVLSVSAWSGKAGQRFTGSFGVTDPAGLAMNIAVSGIPSGMTLALSGGTVTATWTSPVKGSYTLAVTATDSAGRSASASIPLTIQ